MDSTRWKRLEALFIAALELETVERTAFLNEACADDPALHAELEMMLAVDDESIALALESRLLTDDVVEPPEPDSLIGAHIGPYLIEKLIGEGGMGEVYLAKRDDDQFEQKVALKLVRPGYRSSQMLARFRLERQVLARLTHPNITQLLDGGIDNNGRPYLVMQYVEGVSITKFCDKHALSIEDRLGLFRTVCSAVQHAHNNLVVHRDLKPSNILVTEEGVVKLLDFGIAKLLNPGWEAMMTLTRSEVRLMTPEYAAPEQIKGDTITTATDVYALGVLLYELLSGRRPYQLAHHMQAEMERIVCEVAPARPSTAVTEITPGADPERALITAENISKARRTGVSRLKKILQGDLDNIVLMALRKEPERRYVSAEQFSEDIKRYLTGRPVAAEKDRASYRFRKFVHRNKRIVTVTAAAMLLILGFGVIMGIQALQIASQAEHLAEERDRAQMEATKAKQVAAFLENLFEASNPFQATPERRDTLRVRDFLAVGVKNVEQELSDQPEIQAALFDALGHVYRNLGDLQTAEPLLEKALQIRKEIHTTPHVDLAESMAEMAALYTDKGDYDAAQPLQQTSVDMLRALLGDEHPDLAAGLNRLGSLRQDQGDYDSAELLYVEALGIRRRALGEENLDVSNDMNNLASIYYLQSRYNEADSLFRVVLAMRQHLLGPEHPDVAGVMTNLAQVLHSKEDFEGAEALYRESLALRTKVLGPIHPHISGGLNNLAVFLKTIEKYDEAEPYYRKSLAMQRQIYGAEHPEIALSLHNFAAFLKAKGNYEEAAPLYEEALAMRRKLLGNEHPSVAATLNNLGVLYKAQSNYAAAEPLLREALAINRRLLDEGHPRIGLTLDTLGDLLYKTRRFDEAITVFEEAVQILRTKMGEDHQYTIRAIESLEKCRRAREE